MKRFSYILTKPHALHERPISNLVREASRFQSEVQLTYGEKCVGIKHMRKLLGEKLSDGSKLTVTVEGKDEEAAVASIQNYFVANL